MKKLVLFLVSFIVWLVLTWTIYYPSLLIGILISIIIGFWFADLFIQRPRHFFQIKRFLYFLYYIPIFLYYCTLANLDVAYRVLHPYLPIEPGIVKVKTTLKSEVARVALANSITLTPGTVSIRVYGTKITVHAIAEDVAERLEKGAMDRIVTRFEGLS